MSIATVRKIGVLSVDMIVDMSDMFDSDYMSDSDFEHLESVAVAEAIADVSDAYPLDGGEWVLADNHVFDYESGGRVHISVRPVWS